MKKYNLHHIFLCFAVIATLTTGAAASNHSNNAFDDNAKELLKNNSQDISIQSKDSFIVDGDINAYVDDTMRTVMESNNDDFVDGTITIGFVATGYCREIEAVVETYYKGAWYPVCNAKRIKYQSSKTFGTIPLYAKYRIRAKSTDGINENITLHIKLDR